MILIFSGRIGSHSDNLKSEIQNRWAIPSNVLAQADRVILKVVSDQL
jgi:hypothetical protein